MSLLEDVEIDVVLEELAQAEHWVMSWIGRELHRRSAPPKPALICIPQLPSNIVGITVQTSYRDCNYDQWVSLAVMTFQESVYAHLLRP